MLRRSASAVLMVVAFTGSLLAVRVAQAQPGRVEVQAGAVHPTNPAAPYEYTRFYPDTVKVHRGQTVRWNMKGGPAGGFHTITFSKSGRPPIFRADEIPGSYATPEQWALGSDCGRNGLKPCVLKSSTAFLSSGIPPFGNSPFDVKVDLAPGKYRYYCNAHPGMEGAVQVVNSAVRLATQQQIDRQTASQIRADSAAADALFRADQKPVSRVDAEGRREWRVLLGDSTPDDHVSIVAFLPTELEIATGDKVRYVYRDRIINEIHTVTFPTEVTGSANPAPHGLGGLAFFPACDFDDPAGGARGIPGLWGIAMPCPASLELTIAPWMTQTNPAPGNQVLTRATFHDSGLLVPPRAPKGFRVLPDTGEKLPRDFDAEFPTPGSFAYECNVHLDPMTGSINVS